MDSVVEVVVAKGLRRAYADRLALDDFSLAIPGGAVFGLLGPNGSGKSTFISVLAAAEPAQEGELRVFGETPRPTMRARIGTVFQENAQDPLMTVRETLSLAGRLFGVDRATVRARSSELLARFGLAERNNDATGSLSGGMRRRLEVARALLHQPDLLLLDEPTTGVDPGERRALWTALLEGRGQRTILLATNDLAEADAVCDRVAFIRAGKVAALGTPAELKAGLRRESLRLTWDDAAAETGAKLAAWPGVGDVARDGSEFVLSVDDAASLVPRLFAEFGGAIRAVRIAPATLEDAYFRHAGSSPGPPEEAVAR